MIGWLDSAHRSRLTELPPSTHMLWTKMSAYRRIIYDHHIRATHLEENNVPIRLLM